MPQNFPKTFNLNFLFFCKIKNLSFDYFYLHKKNKRNVFFNGLNIVKNYKGPYH